MNTQLEAGLRVTVSAMLAVLLTLVVMAGIGNDARAAVARVTAAGAQLTQQWAALAQAPVASHADAPAHAG